MSIKLGTTDINGLYLGETAINKAYLGSTEVFGIAGPFNNHPTLGVGITSYYKFDTDGSLPDSTPNGNDGSTSGATFDNGGGIIDSAYDFDGSNTITVPNVINGLTDFTINIWVNLQDKGANQRLMAFGSDSNNLVELAYDWNVDKFYFSKRVSGTYTRTQVESPVVYGSYRMTTIIKTGNSYELCLDGVTTGITHTTTQTNSILELLADINGGSLAFGLADETGIWDKAITSQECSDLDNSGAGLTY